MTIEERAKEFSRKYGCEHALVDKHHGTVYCPNKIECSKQLPHEIEELYIQIATEQDCITRAEERERCINAVQDAFCNEKQCKKFWLCDHCCEKVMIAINGIKAIEKGIKYEKTDDREG